MQLPGVDLTKLSTREQSELLALLDKIARDRFTNRIDTFYPDYGEFRRELYRKHLEFFAAGAEYRERCFMAANRIGKTEGAGAYETALHLTGQYPSWWKGRRFDRPVRGWAAGKTNETTRDIVQTKLLGKVVTRGDRKWLDGTGMVRAACLDRPPLWKPGFPDLVDTVHVRHVSGEYSTIGLKSYQQGRGAFEGTEQDFVWFDEEPPLDCYAEALIRTMTTNGLIYITFTPLDGATETVLQFLPGSMLNDLMEEAKKRARRQ